MEHVLKCWPEFFEAVAIGVKNADIRKNDRNYKVGDTIKFLEFIPTANIYTGKYIKAKINYVLKDFEGIEEGYAVLCLDVRYNACGFDVSLAGRKPE